MSSFIFDTSAFINAWRFHYPPSVFEGVWATLGEAMDTGRIVAPIEVLVELEARSGDDLHVWAKAHRTAFLEPGTGIGRQMDRIRGFAPHWFKGAGRHEADPFVVAMALESHLPLVTYEGVAFSGDPTNVKGKNRSMPIVCSQLGVQSLIPPEALVSIGAHFRQ